MTWLQPLWWLAWPLLTFLLLVLHARRRSERLVPRLSLWSRVPLPGASSAMRRHVPWRDPRLWLQWLVLTSVVATLAEPRVGADATVDHWVVVIDASASMNAASDGSTRLEDAIAMVGERFGTRTTGAMVSVVRAGADVYPVAASWPTGRGLSDALDAIEPGGGRPDWATAGEWVELLARAGDRVRVVVYTDAAGAEGWSAMWDRGVVPAPLPTEVIALGGTFLNVGLDDVRATLRGERSDQWLLEGRVSTVGLEGGETVRIVASYRPFGGSTFLQWGAVDVTVDREGLGAFDLPLDLPGPGELEVRGPSSDQFSDDDRVIVALRPDPIRVAIVGPRPPPLLRALAAVDGVAVFVSDDAPTVDETAEFDLVVITADVDVVPATSTLWFGVVPEGVGSSSVLDVPLALLERGAHALAADLDVEAMGLRRADPLRLLSGASSLVTSGGVPIAWARTTTVGRQVVLGFGLDDGDWAAQVSFPAFVAALVDWSATRSWSHDTGSCRVGLACAWPRAAFLDGWTLVDPSGVPVEGSLEARAVAGDPLADAVWDEAWFDSGFRPVRPGRYALVWDGLEVGLPVTDRALGGAVAAPLGVASIEPARDGAWRLAPWLVSIAIVATLVDLILGRPAVRTRLRLRRRTVWIGPTIAVVAWLLALVAAPVPWVTAGGAYVWLAPVGADRGPTLPAGWSLQRLGIEPLLADDGVDGDVRAQDVVRGLELALALPSNGASRRVGLDAGVAGASVAEDLVPVLRRLVAAGVRVDQLAPAAPAGADPVAEDATTVAAFGRIELPEDVRAGATFAVRARIDTEPDVAWRWSAQLLRAPEDDASSADGADPSPPHDVEAEATGVGAGRATLDLPAGGPGDHVYRLRLASADAAVIFQEVEIVVTVGPRVRVLLVTDDDVQGELWTRAVVAQDVEVRSVTPFRLPATVEALAAYDAVVLVNVAASALFTEYQENLETYVRARGGGLLLLGGPRAFGPGGYFRTPLEDVSPLSAQVTDEAPEVAMVFVLDRSGSMNAAVGTASRMDVAKRATLEAIELLGPGSQAAVVVFDAEAEVLIPYTPVASTATFESALGAVRAAGGTSIYPGLVEAYELVRSSDAAARHVIVMTDGLSQEGDFAVVLDALRDLGATTSFVGVGDAADRRQLATLATLAGGTLHFALDFRSLPAILAQEALMVSAAPIVDEAARTDWIAGALPPFVGPGTALSPPSLGGYVRTMAKPEATVHLIERSRDDPVLATWRYGLGRVVAYASEVDGPWAGSLVEDPAYGPFWSQAVRWVTAPAVRDGWFLDVQTSTSSLGVVLDAPTDEPPSLTSDLVVVLEADGRTVARRALRWGNASAASTRFDVSPTWSGLLTVRVEPVPELGLEPGPVRSIAWPPPPDDVAGGWVPYANLAASTGGVGPDVALDVPRTAPVWHGRDVPGAWALTGLVAFVVALLGRYGATPSWPWGGRRSVRQPKDEQGRWTGDAVR